jgi:hypothetical protein
MLARSPEKTLWRRRIGALRKKDRYFWVRTMQLFFSIFLLHKFRNCMTLKRSRPWSLPQQTPLS